MTPQPSGGPADRPAAPRHVDVDPAQHVLVDILGGELRDADPARVLGANALTRARQFRVVPRGLMQRLASARAVVEQLEAEVLACPPPGEPRVVTTMEAPPPPPAPAGTTP